MKKSPEGTFGKRGSSRLTQAAVCKVYQSQFLNFSYGFLLNFS